jgi:hypothetical protein
MEKEGQVCLQKLQELLGLACEYAANELFFDSQKIRAFKNSALVFQIDNPDFEGLFKASFILPERFISKNQSYLLHKSAFYSYGPFSLKITILPENSNAEILPWELSSLDNYLSSPKPLNFVISKDDLARYLFLQQISERLPKFGMVPFWSGFDIVELINSEFSQKTVYFLKSGFWQADLELLLALRHLKIITFLEGRELKKKSSIDAVFKVKKVKKLCPYCKQPDPLPSVKLLTIIKKLPNEAFRKYISKPALFKKQGCPRCDFGGYDKDLLVWESSFSNLSLEEALTLLALKGEISQEEVFA